MEETISIRIEIFHHRIKHINQEGFVLQTSGLKLCQQNAYHGITEKACGLLTDTSMLDARPSWFTHQPSIKIRQRPVTTDVARPNKMSHGDQCCINNYASKTSSLEL